MPSPVPVLPRRLVLPRAWRSLIPFPLYASSMPGPFSVTLNRYSVSFFLKLNLDFALFLVIVLDGIVEEYVLESHP